ncbi:MAG: hypothetical protein HY204_07145 [Nitrospirae bacterium]|nr:hypothetical protein [Nitrospirota bacterium]
MDLRFQRKLRPVAILTLFFFAWISIEPWNYTVWAQTAQKNGDRPAAATASKSTSGKFEESLRAAKKVVEELDQDVASGKDITLQLESLKGYKQNLEAADPEIRAEFASTEAFIKQKKLPKAILARYAKTLKEYQANLKALTDQIDALSQLEAERKQAEADNDRPLAQKKQKDLQVRIKAVRDQLKTQVREPRHQPEKPSEIPNRTRELRPLKTSWLKPVMDWLVPSAYAAEPPPPGPADLAETLETPQTQEIHDLAVQLGSTPVALYEFVRNNFKYEPYVGSVKGATQTLKEKAGNEWDQASLLIALLRAAGYPARYVVGTVEIPVDQAMSWLGLEDANMAASLLYTQGRSTSLIYSGGKISSIRTRQVWVSAYVPFLHSRGAATGPGDTWVDLDPSMKTQTATQTLSLTGAPVFDSTAYLSTFRTQSPVDFYKGQLSAIRLREQVPI